MNKKKNNRGKIIAAAFILAALMIFGIWASGGGSPRRAKEAPAGETGPAAVLDRNGKLLALTETDGTIKLAEDAGPALSRLLGAPALMGGSPCSVLGSGLSQGDSIRLTIDAGLSSVIYGLLEKTGADRGAVLVFNYRTGEILAAVSAGGFSDVAQALKEDGSFDKETYSNMPFQDKIMPGSAIRPILLAAAAETDPALADTSYDCRGLFAEGDTWVRCLDHEEHGHIENVEEGLRDNDCTAYMLYVTGRADRDVFYGKLKAFGFDAELPSGSQVPCAGLTFCGRDPEYLSGTDLLMARLGHGPAAVSMLGLSRAFAALFNGGESPAPLIVRDLPAGESITMCSSETAARILAGMERAARGEVSGDGDENGRRICTFSGFGEYPGRKPSMAVWAAAGVHPEDLQKGDENAWLVLSCLDHYAFKEGESAGNTAGALAEEVLRQVTALKTAGRGSRMMIPGAGCHKTLASFLKEMEENGGMPCCLGAGGTDLTRYLRRDRKKE